MNLKKKLLMIIAVLPIFITTALANYSDVKSSDWFYNDVTTLSNTGVISGYTDGTYKPYNNVSNGEVLTLVNSAFGYSTTPTASGTHWALKQYNAAVANGIITASSLSSSSLDDKATRTFVANCVFNALNISTINSMSPFVDVDNDVLNTLYHLGIANGSYTNGELYFKPNNSINRAEVAVLISKAVKVNSNKSSISKQTYVQPRTSVVSAPKTQAEYEQVLIYMANNNYNSLQLTYPTTAFDDLYQYYKHILPAFESVFETYPEIFTFANELSFGGSATGTNSSILVISLKSYYFDSSTASSMKSQFITECENVVYTLQLAGDITTSMTQYQKAKVLFEWLVLNKSYDTYYRDVSYTGYGISHQNTGVCQSYVANLNVMLKLLGINAYGVSGKVGTVDHMWSKASLDGVMVYMDPTFADPTPDTKGYCDFTYFDISEANLRKTHTF